MASWALMAPGETAGGTIDRTRGAGGVALDPGGRGPSPERVPAEAAPMEVSGGEERTRGPGEPTLGPADATETDPATPGRVGPAARRPGTIPWSRSLEPGERIGRFVVLSKVGAGGMGVVYAAYDPELDRKVAVKLLHDVGSAGEVRRARLHREAQAMARVVHPNVITVYDVGTLGGEVFVAMEFVDGTTLGAWMRAPGRRPREVLDVFAAAGRGLAAAHAVGLVHRDFKPDNVLVGRDGRVRVMDFGLATAARPASDDGLSAGGGGGTDSRALPDDSDRRQKAGPMAPWEIERSAGASDAFAPLTRTGALLGTPAYMSPEQHLGLDADARSDQFSFCVALYEALYGCRPFAGDRHAVLAAHVIAGDVRPPPRRKGVPRHVRNAVLRGLSADPEARFPTMDALVDALEADPHRRLRRAGIAGGAALLVLGGALFAVKERSSRETLCEGAAAPVQALLAKEHRDALVESLSGALPPQAGAGTEEVARRLSRFAEKWGRVRHEACLDTHVRSLASDDLLDAKTACLDAQLRDVRALVRELESADRNAALRAVEAVADLPDPSVCADADHVLRRYARAAGTAMPKRAASALATARARFAVGRYEAALEAADRAATELRGAPALARAEVQLARGEALEKLGRFEEARSALVAAYDQAMRAGAGDVAFDAARALVHTVGYRMADASAGQVFADLAARWTDDLSDPRRRGQLESAVGSMWLAKGDPERALAHYEAASAFFGALNGVHPDALWADNNRAVALGKLGRTREALKLHGRTLAARIHLLGAGHPDVAVSLANQASILSAEGELDRAAELYAQAYEIRRQALGEDHVDVAGTLNNLASVMEERGRSREAADAYGKARAILRRRLGPAHPNTVAVTLNLAAVRTRRGDLARARELLSEAVAHTAGGDAEPVLAAEARYLLARVVLLEAGAQIPEDPTKGGLSSKLRRVGSLRALEEARRLLEAARARLGSRDTAYDPELWDFVAALEAAVDAQIASRR